MLSNQNNTQMPESMPGSMPGSMPENNNTTHNAMNEDAEPSIGGPHKIQSGILHHGLPVDNTDNVHNNTHGEHNFSKDKSLVNNAASGMNGNQNDMNPLHSNHGENRIGNNNDHHFKRNAALGAGAAGLAGHEMKNHQDQQFGFENHRAGGNSHQPGLGHSSHEGAINNPLQPGNDNLRHSSNNDDHHYKRDAALGAGAAGLAGHEMKNHQDQQFGFENHRAGGNSHQSGLGHSGHEGAISNPLQPGNDNLRHSSNNDDHHYKRDAALGAGAAGLAGHEMKNHQDQQFGFENHRAGGNSHQSGLGYNNHEGAINDPLHSKDDKLHHSSSNDDHHYKRNAALGAGATGLAGHEMKNHQDQQFGFENHRAGGNSHQSGLGYNNHEGAINDPLHSKDDKLHHSSSNDDHHYKRNAALGAGATGLAGHELKNHHGNANPLQSGVGHNNHEGINNSNPLHTEAGLGHSSAGNPLHPGAASSSNDNDHHYKRDAALGAGAAGLAGHELKNHRDKESGLDGHHRGSNPLHSGSGLDNHHSATGNPLHPGSDNINRSVDGNNDHHYKRDAALGTGAAGLAGHELKNHHDNQATVDSHRNGSNPIHPGSENINHSVDGNNDHHYKRDAALGAGAAGLAGHELKNHRDKESGLDGHHRGSNPLHSGSGLDNHHSATGNPLHPGSDNINRSVDGNNNHHYKRDAALGTGVAGLAGHELKNHHDKETGLNNHHTSSGNPLHSGPDNVNRSVDGNNDHHYKRDAALGAGAAGLAGHELKNHQDKQSNVDGHHGSSGNPLHPSSDNLSHTPGGNDHHYKRDAALGAGAAGVAGHEMKEHHDKKEAASNRTSISSAGSGEKKGAAVHDKPLNTGGDAHHVAEQPPMGLGGLTGKQPVGEINFHKLS